MKKRKLSRRRNSANCGRNWLRPFEKQNGSKRRTWTFERLEDRQFFTASPVTGLEGWQWMSVSNNTAQGQQLIDSMEQMWAEQSSAGQGGGSATATATALAFPTDPYLNYQWHLLNVGQIVNPGQFQDIYGVPGQDINVAPAWDLGYSGLGVNVAVVDDGVQLDHPDLIDNILFEYAYDAIRNRPGGGNLSDEDNHGTAVAGLIGAVGNNGLGGAGVAYGANLIPIKFLGAGSTNDTFINAIGANGAPVDIYNHSWGYFNGRSVVPLSTEMLIALSNSARLGRNGLGSIHVFASGNFAGELYSAGSSALVNSRYTIGVGMVDHDGQVDNSDGTTTKYGNMAPSVLVVAPSASGPIDIINDFNTGSGIFTTDRTAEDLGYNVPPLPSGVELDIDTFPDDDYTSRFGGTSAAAPLVSGVIALMLEANPNLTYRDVQEILVRSARQNNDLDESWITNLVPLFRDPIPHNPGPTNYPGEESLYPSDENQWNDEIVYKLIYGVEYVTAPAVQAEVNTLDEFGQFSPGIVAVNSEVTIIATEDKLWDGWVANNLSVTFRPQPGEISGAFAEIIGSSLRVTVIGEGVTWGEIEAVIEALGQPNPNEFDPAESWFQVEVTDPAGVFDPADEGIRARFVGGVDATGIGDTENVTEVERNPLYQGYHPIADPLTNPDPLSSFTNGAGYTVSHGRGGNSEYGWAHGVVDAGLAVELARQWHLKDQNLPTEKTYLVGGFGSIPIRGAQVTNEESGEYVIPGGLSNSTDGFAEYFNEFFKEPTITAATEGDPEADPPTESTPEFFDPMSLPFREDDPPANTRGTFLEFDIPAIDPVSGGSNVMSMEWAEVQLTISGSPEAMNYLRIVLVSPDGTHSELTQNQYDPADIQHNFQHLATGGVFTSLEDGITPTDENGTSSNTLSWVYSTNRVWGERSDSKILYNEYGEVIGVRGWQLHFENYSSSNLQLNGVSFAVHGSPIGSSAAPVERVMGKVGVDSGRFDVTENAVLGANDGVFNFDRSVTAYSTNTSALTTSNTNFSDTPFGLHEVLLADESQESFVGNATVYVIDNPTGQRVAQFVTGADGNYYFDLPAGEYTIGVEDPLERDALADGRNYDNEWVITIDGDDFFAREAAQIDAVTGKVDFFNDLNFLLDPGSIPIGEVVFEGQVIGDLNGNAVQDDVDAGVFNFLVFADLNHTGQFELGESFTYTDPDGNYELHVPTGTPNTFSIIVKPPAGWTATAPATATINEYARPGEVVTGFKYLFAPPTEPTGIGNGNLFGFVFDDKNGDGIQQINEKGLANVRVFIDVDLDGVWDDDGTERSTLTSTSGSYQLGEVAPGTIRLDAIVEEPYLLTSPTDGWIDVTLSAGQVSQANVFAVQNLAVNDYGDLVGDDFNTNGGNAASHFVVPGFQLGARLDAEVRPRNMKLDPNVLPGDPNYPQYIIDPDLHGIGDDAEENEASFDDEDGVVLTSGYLKPGTNFVSVTVGGVGGYLQGWIDFDDDGVLEASERVFNNEDLNPGTHLLPFNVPQSIDVGEVAARFRWGTLNLGATGHAIIGEVEDYVFEVKKPIAGDYNADDVVNDADYQLWISTFGSTVDLRADGNSNGAVDAGDYAVWRDNYGTMAASGSGSAGLAAASSEEPQIAQISVSAAPAPLAVQLSTTLPAIDENPLGAVVELSSSTVSGGGAGIAAAASENDSDEVDFNLSNVTGIQFTSTASARESSFGEIRLVDSANETSTANLLLVDRALARFVTEDEEESSIGAPAFGDSDDTEYLDLALAAAFEEEGSWWSAL